MSKAQQSELENNDSEAEKTYRIVLAKNPNHAEAHHRLAILADKQKDFKTSEHHYKKSLEKLPGSPDLLNDFGYSLFLQKRFEESKRYLQQALNVDPKNRRTVSNLALVQGSLGYLADAFATLLKVHSRTTANRIMDQLFSDEKSNELTIPKELTTPTVSIEGVQPLPMEGMAGNTHRTAKNNATDNPPVGIVASSSSIIQVPLSTSREGLLDKSVTSGPASNSKNKSKEIGTIRPASLSETFPIRGSNRSALYRGPNTPNLAQGANVPGHEVLRFYHQKALILGHNVGHEGFLFPVFESSSK